MPCSIDDCENDVLAHGWCRKHYLRWYKTGSTDATRGGTVEEKYARAVIKKDGDQCWDWDGQFDCNFGYGRLHTGGYGSPRVFAHRVSYEIHNGPIPEGQFVLHKCDNPRCTNPAHLFLGSMADNVADMDNKGRRRAVGRKGEDHLKAKLSEEQVREIRASPLGYLKLSKIYNVSTTTIRYIKIRRIWNHIT